MNNHDIDAILSVQLLIARAGNRDSLGWWDDDTLSIPAAYVLQRIFPVAPPLAGRRLALEAALARHQALVPASQRSLHLYRLALDNRDRMATRFDKLESITVPVGPITTMDALRVHLLELTGNVVPSVVEHPGPGATVQVRLPPCPDSKHPLVHRAQTLAWAYFHAPDGQCVIPYCLDEP